MNMGHKLHKLNKNFLSFNQKKSFALGQLDLKMGQYLNYRKGFFVEAGANDGIRQSNTLYFEKYFDWKGILVEPIPDLAAKCRRNRPKSVVVNCALVPFDYQKSSIELQYFDLMTTAKGALKVEDEKNYYQLIDEEGFPTYQITSQARTLNSILDENGVDQFDFFSLDVEGFELNVLKGLDFDKYQPTYMLIEARYRDEIEDFLRPLYEPIAEMSHKMDVLYGNVRKI